MVLLLLLTACSTDDNAPVDDDRQFANQPQTAAPTTALATPPAFTGATPVRPTAAPTLTASQLTHSRGAPVSLYALLPGGVVTYSVTDEGVTSNTWQFANGVTGIDITASPSGKSAAVLLSSSAGTHVVFIDDRGQPVNRSAATASAQATASPHARPSPVTSGIGGMGISWIANGGGVLEWTDKTLAVVLPTGSRTPLTFEPIDGTIRQAAMSPRRNQVALLVSDRAHTDAIWIVDVGTGTSTKLEATMTDEHHGLESLQWTPDGAGIVYIYGEREDDVLLNGQLFVVGNDASRPLLIATSGQGGQSATIRDAIVSPDGRAVAYTIGIRDGSRWVLHSAWVRSMDGNSVYRLPVVAGSSVVRLQWSRQGLVWEVWGSSEVRVFGVSETSEPRNYGSIKRPVGATPVASPAGSAGSDVPATPDGTPVSAPGQSTPVPEPDSTPAGSPEGADTSTPGSGPPSSAEPFPTAVPKKPPTASPAG